MPAKYLRPCTRAFSGSYSTSAATSAGTLLAQRLDGQRRPGRERERQVRVRDHPAHRVAVGGAAHAPDDLALGEHGLAAVDALLAAVADGQRAQAALDSPRALRLDRRAPREVALALECHAEAEPRLVGRVPGREVAAEGAVALLHAQRVEHPVAGGPDAVARAGGRPGDPRSAPPTPDLRTSRIRARRRR